MIDTDFENVVTNEQISDIADAIRALTSLTTGMTVLEMPTYILDFKDLVGNVINSLLDALCWEGVCDKPALEDIENSVEWRGGRYGTY